jgi:hypothetical protein
MPRHKLVNPSSNCPRSGRNVTGACVDGRCFSVLCVATFVAFRAVAQLDRLASQPEAELEQVPVIAAPPPKPIAAPAKPPPPPATVSSASTFTQRQPIAANHRAPPKPKQKVFGGRPVKPANAPQSPLPLRTVDETQMLSTMRSTNRLPVSQPAPEDVTFAKAQEFAQQNRGVAASPAAAQPAKALDVFGAPPKPVEHQNIAAVLAQRDEDWQPVARQGSSPTTARKLKLKIKGNDVASVSPVQQDNVTSQQGRKQCVPKRDGCCKQKRVTVADLRPAGIKTPKSAGVESALRWFAATCEDEQEITSSRVSRGTLPAGLPRGPASHLFADHVREALIWTSTDCDCDCDVC